MSKTWEREYEKIKKIKEEFVNEYMRSGPFSEYINHVGLTTIDVSEWAKKRFPESVSDKSGEPKGLKRVRDELIAAGENPEEWVIEVGLEKSLPCGMELPKNYKGFKVISIGVIGEIRAL